MCGCALYKEVTPQHTSIEQAVYGKKLDYKVSNTIHLCICSVNVGPPTWTLLQHLDKKEILKGPTAVLAELRAIMKILLIPQFPL